MVDQLLHPELHVAPVGREEILVRRAHRPRAQAVEALPDDSHRLLHLLDAAEIAVVDVAVLPHRNLEFVRLVAEIRRRLPHVVGNAASTERRAGAAEIDRLLGGERADADRALHPYPILREQILVLSERGREFREELAHRRHEGIRDILEETAHAEVRGRHTGAGAQVVQVEELLPLAEAVEEDAHRPEVERMGPEPDQVRGDPRDLEEDDPEGLCAIRHLGSEDLLDRADVRHVVSERRHVVHPVGHRERLGVRLRLHDLFHARVEVAHHGLQAHDGLAVQFDDQPQHSVRGGVLRPHVDGDGLEFGRDLGRGGVHSGGRPLRRSAPRTRAKGCRRPRGSGLRRSSPAPSRP